MRKNFLPGWRYGCLLGVLLAFCTSGCELLSRPPLVGVVFWGSEVPAFLENWWGVMEGLREEGYQDGVNVRLVVANVMGKRDEAAAAARRFQAEGARLLITVGTVPTLVALEATRESRLPLVYSMVAAPEENGLGRPEPGEEIRFTGTSSEVPAREQLRFLLQAKPELRRLGVLYCSATPQAVATGHAAVAAAREMGLLTFWQAIPDDGPLLLQKALTALLREGVEAVFLPSDPILAAPHQVRSICEILRTARVPLIAPTGDCVANGALLAYHADFADIGRQAGRQAARLLRGAHPRELPPEGPQVKRLTLNLMAASELGLTLPWQLLSRANALHH